MVYDEKRISITCNGCGTTYDIDSSKIPEGKTVTGKCKKCGNDIIINTPNNNLESKSASKTKPAICPKCAASVDVSATECFSCGVVFKKFYNSVNKEQVKIAGESGKSDDSKITSEQIDTGKNFGEATFLRKLKKSITSFPAIQKGIKWFGSLPVWKKVFLIILLCFWIYRLADGVCVSKFDFLAILILSPISFVLLVVVPYFIINKIVEDLIGSAPSGAKKKKPFFSVVSGGAVIIIGVIAVFFSLNMKTSISSGYGEISNLELMNNKQIYVIISCFTIFVGICITVFSALRGELSKKNNKALTTPVGDEKECPACAEMVKVKAKKCRFCGHSFGE